MADPPTPASTDWLAETLLLAADTAGIGVMLTTAGESGLKNVFANPAAVSMFGRDDLLDVDPMTILTGDERSRLDRLVPEFSSNGACPATDTTIATRPDGSQVSVEIAMGTVSVNGDPGVVTFIADVTPLYAAVDSLKKSELRFRSVIESIPEAIFITDGSRLGYTNRAFVELFGTGAEGSASVDVFDFVHRDDAEGMKQRLAAIAEVPISNTECRMTSTDGTVRTLEISAIGIDLDGRPAVLWFGRDVTQRRLLESQILQADRLAVLGTLAAGMAHAINNPLSYTLLNLEHVARRIRRLAVEHEYYAEARVRLAEAHDGADRVAKIVRQMRALSRTRPSSPRRIDVRAVLESVLAVVGNEIRYRGQLVTRYDVTPLVYASESELEQAFLGLLLYVARLHPEEVSSGREIRLSTMGDDSGHVVVSISDDGPPLDPDVRARLFDPFSDGKSMGLGLAMCHAIFTASNGQLEIISAHLVGGLGTTFQVTLPAAVEDSPESAPLPARRPSSPPETPSSRAKVLVIDDDPGVASTLRAMLKTHHEVKSVERSREGLRILLGDQPFDIVFCDLVMPEISGIDLYRSLELNRPEALSRIVFMTGGVFTPEAERFLARVPNQRIEKPFSLARIEQLLAQAVNRRRMSSAP